jgi:homogentisate 1,2-dioxygenase
MGYLSDFQRGQFAGARLVGASVSKTATYLMYAEQQFPVLRRPTNMATHHQLRGIVTETKTK